MKVSRSCHNCANWVHKDCKLGSATCLTVALNRQIAIRRIPDIERLVGKQLTHWVSMCTTCEDTNDEMCADCRDGELGPRPASY